MREAAIPLTQRLTRAQMPDMVEKGRIVMIPMGGEVDPRRRFIQQNAPKARNPDV